MRNRRDSPRGGRGAQTGATGQLRLIAGSHRGRRIRFADAPGLRPTTDRVRETLFNWLAPWLPGSVCVDLFAGSGALAFEALSRGAREAILIERDSAAHALLESNRNALGFEHARIIRADAIEWLTTADLDPVDLLLLDPPFDSDLLERSIKVLTQRVAPRWVYAESSARASAPTTPAGWRVWRERRYGDTRFQLFDTTDPTPPAGA